MPAWVKVVACIAPVSAYRSRTWGRHGCCRDLNLDVVCSVSWGGGCPGRWPQGHTHGSRPDMWSMAICFGVVVAADACFALSVLLI